MEEELQTAASQVSMILEDRGLKLKQECVAEVLQAWQYVEGLSEQIKSVQGDHPFDRFLSLDMNECGDGVLPPNVNELIEGELTGPFVLQVIWIENVCAPFKERLKNAEPGKRQLKLTMTDGVQFVFGLEWTPIKELNVEEPPLLKVLINNVQVMRGYLLLVPEAISILRDKRQSKRGYHSQISSSLCRSIRPRTANSRSMDARIPNRVSSDSGERSKVIVEPYKFDGVFIAKGRDDALCTKNMVPGEAAGVCNEEIISVQTGVGTKVEYRVWNRKCSRLAAAIFNADRAEDIWIKPGARVLYLGAGSGTNVSHVSDIVGPYGMVYAVEISPSKGRELANMAEKRTNVVPIINDATDPVKYKILVGRVDVICSDIADPYQVRNVALNASYCLKERGHVMIIDKGEYLDPEVDDTLGELFMPIVYINAEQGYFCATASNKSSSEIYVNGE